MPTHTKIDDTLIEMISPKLKEIEGRFSKGEGLSNDDINTLLLKSQFNHINHLDEKLDEVTADVASLKTDMKSLEAKFGGLEAKFGEMKAEIKLEIQTAINKNMQWSIGLIAFMVAALKLIDTIWGK
jgi:uncharacterized coiled-coil DUF342 family protein